MSFLANIAERLKAVELAQSNPEKAGQAGEVAAAQVDNPPHAKRRERFAGPGFHGMELMCRAALEADRSVGPTR